MVDMTDEELKQFLKENSARIKELLADEKDLAEDIRDGLKTDLGKSADRVKEKLSEEKEKVGDAFKDVYKAIMDPTAHRHFVRMGLEFFMGLSAIMDKMPVPSSVKEFREDVEASRASVQKEFCKANPNCGAKKNGTDEDIERIEID